MASTELGSRIRSLQKSCKYYVWPFGSVFTVTTRAGAAGASLKPWSRCAVGHLMRRSGPRSALASHCPSLHVVLTSAVACAPLTAGARLGHGRSWPLLAGQRAHVPLVGPTSSRASHLALSSCDLATSCHCAACRAEASLQLSLRGHRGARSTTRFTTA